MVAGSGDDGLMKMKGQIGEWKRSQRNNQDGVGGKTIRGENERDSQKGEKGDTAHINICSRRI
jgi:hypothetical protein